MGSCWNAGRVMHHAECRWRQTPDDTRRGSNEWSYADCVPVVIDGVIDQSSSPGQWVNGSSDESRGRKSLIGHRRPRDHQSWPHDDQSQDPINTALLFILPSGSRRARRLVTLHFHAELWRYVTNIMSKWPTVTQHSDMSCRSL